MVIPPGKQWLMDCLNDLGHFIFPLNCHGCKRSLYANEPAICISCQAKLPLTHFWNFSDNPVARLFWAKVPLEAACSYCFFEKGNVVQDLMHALKYKGRTEVGGLMGGFFAGHLMESGFPRPDVIVPVPLHISKLEKRGYNQCSSIANGMGEVWKVEVNEKTLVRTRANQSQTRKGVFDRFLNTQALFEVTEPTVFEGKHVLLVDDVVTTGSTLEACAQAVAAVKNTKVSVATLAMAV